MSKKRKTRKEKIIAQQRSIETVSHVHSHPIYSFNNSAPARKDISIPTTSSSTISYSYVGHDAKQTLLITSLLVVSSIVLHILIQTHVVNLSFLGY